MSPSLNVTLPVAFRKSSVAKELSRLLRTSHVTDTEPNVLLVLVMLICKEFPSLAVRGDRDDKLNTPLLESLLRTTQK